MKVFRGLPTAESRAPCALTIGNFDGVHLGHQALLARVREAAAKLGLDAAVFEGLREESAVKAECGASPAVKRIRRA